MKSQAQLSECCQFCFKSNTSCYLCGSCGIISCTHCSNRTLAPQFTSPEHRTRFCRDCSRAHSDVELFEIASNRQIEAAEQQAEAEALEDNDQGDDDDELYTRALVDLADRNLPQADFLCGMFCTPAPFGEFGQINTLSPRRRR